MQAAEDRLRPSSVHTRALRLAAEYSLTMAAAAEIHACRGSLTTEESEGDETRETHSATVVHSRVSIAEGGVSHNTPTRRRAGACSEDTLRHNNAIHTSPKQRVE